MSTPAQLDAIQSDVPTDDQPESIVAIRSNREIAMEQIELANNRRMEAESGVKLVPDEDVTPIDQEVEKQLAPVVKTVKIDGEERTVTEDELIRSYQKNQAADRRLEEAAQLLREAQERNAQLAAQVQNTPPAAQPTTPEASADLRDEVKATLSVIYGGDEEAAAEALTNLLAKNRGGDQPTPTVQMPSVDALADAVEQRLEINTAFAKFKTDYPDLIADPDLEILTARKIDRLEAQGIPRAQAMLSAGAEVYQLLGKQPAGRPNEPTPPKPNARQDNKERLETIRSASSSATIPTPVYEDNPSSVIQEMAARRLGQSTPQRSG